jgi:hypothetical protein
MRNPTHAVAKIRGLLVLGRRVVDTFENFVKENPETLDIGKNFGTKNYKGPSTELARNCRDTLRRDLGAPAELKPGREFSRARCARASCHALATRVCEVCGNWYCEGCTTVEPVDPRRCLCLQCFSDVNPVVQQTDFAPGPEATDGEAANPGPSAPRAPHQRGALPQVGHSASRALSCEHLAGPPHTARHTGASRDLAEHRRSFSQVKRRGRWKTDEAIQRYARPHVWPGVRAQVPPDIMARGKKLMSQREADGKP